MVQVAAQALLVPVVLMWPVAATAAVGEMASIRRREVLRVVPAVPVVTAVSMDMVVPVVPVDRQLSRELVSLPVA